jgi:hypothetical protein
MTTWAPDSRKPLAVAKPMPLEEPVTKTWRPVKSIFMRGLLD